MIDARIKIRHLQCFLETARLRHVGRAADRLHITQPAVSKAIRELEDILAVRLFERSGRGLALTSNGRLFQRYAQTGMVSLEQAVDGAKLNRVRGSAVIQVGALPTVAARLIPHAVERLLDDRPDAMVRLFAGHNRFLYDRLRGRDLDIVVGRAAEPDQMIGLQFEQLYTERLALVVRPGHPLLGRAGLELRHVLDHTLILPTPEDIIRPTVDRFLIAHGVGAVERRIETVSSDFGRNFVATRDAVWIISLGVVALDLAAGALVELPFDLDETAGPVGMTTRADESTPGITLAFMGATRTAAASRVRNLEHPTDNVAVMGDA
ncbi:MAG TPA: pca operon transcription factor PcaQ [Geminicoccaceae bacterium]|nr:pca operon transcription factor PcaQ [Geminicoccaceae bacterium]